ncbi:hypothetical protein SAMN05660420_02144 [Desulfuromusa kysingii]|uniref:Uncharacterized protein n=1 Tax=Desulfuromusa kysingii TaxID=37625 RepID=A0A1H4BCW0_9BACT|nr:hypothetical protein [Desulfuromusa kysingii]SEA46035.1 hypothetical protein SAMN05660420_02144 [Desulfuromusa kysingii]
MSLWLIYTIGLCVAVCFALIWSFILDRNKPPRVQEFLAKLVARILFIIVIFAVFMGFLYLAFGVFR